jgi:hypothetical protein
MFAEAAAGTISVLRTFKSCNNFNATYEWHVSVSDCLSAAWSKEIGTSSTKIHVVCGRPYAEQRW